MRAQILCFRVSAILAGGGCIPVGKSTIPGTRELAGAREHVDSQEGSGLWNRNIFQMLFFCIAITFKYPRSLINIVTLYQHALKNKKRNPNL